ncbi:hypothetical protein QKU58_gp144 [Pyramimonas orientalis virus]|uniref:Uncharacterized protein n=1 Tax=Pyramimonas orientalis virus 01B TaxID=3134525 RepID=A0A7M4CES7_9VIRU|nr:hypothetical protein QKU58_gp144 [Pyramimonas orientalis virus]QOI90187.1 hypothetical protein HWQ62_00050 [Pyramimonas orientalis virus]
MNQQRDIIVREYLRQQQEQANMINDDFTEQLTNDINVHHNQLVTTTDNTSEDELREFKEQVKSWLKLDNETKAINAKIKILDNERKHRKKLIDVFSKNILTFMGNNEIDELNSKDGVIKYKKSYVKEHLSQKLIREKLLEQFNSTIDAEEKINKVFKERDKVEVLRLKRT